jgi:hypothetical protein
MLIGAIIAVSSTYNISSSRAVMHLMNDAILLSFDTSAGAIKNLTIGQTGYNPAQSVTW